MPSSMTRTRNKGKKAAQCSPEAFDVHIAQLQCLAAVNQAWSPDAATDEERLLVAIARACISSSLIKNGEAFEISQTCSSVVNTAKQSTETSYKDSKLKTILQLPQSFLSCVWSCIKEEDCHPHGCRPAQRITGHQKRASSSTLVIQHI